VLWEPMGVARRRAGGMGRALTGCPSLEPFMTGLAFGDGGMDRPRRGVRAPPWERPPGTGGRRRGTVDMVGCMIQPRSEEPALVPTLLRLGLAVGALDAGCSLRWSVMVCGGLRMDR
jgi:hypothetical protein